MTPDLALRLTAVALTYALHSTLLLSAAWLIDRRRRLPSHALREWLWKTAAVAPIVTTALALACQWSHPVLQLSLAPTGETQHDALRRPPDSVRHAAAAPHAKLVADAESVIRHAPASAELPGDAATRQANDVGPIMPEPGDKLQSGALPASSADEAAAKSSTGNPGQPMSEFDDVGVQRSAGDSRAHGSSGAFSPWTASAVGAVVGLLVLLLFMTGGIASCLLRGARLARHFVSATVLCEGPARAALDRLCRRARLWRGVRLLASPRTREPLAFGLLRPTIVLPLHIEQRLTRRQLEALLAHELAHLARGDVAWLWIGQLLCTCLVFQPLNLLARRRWQAAAEFQCDDWALARGVAPLELARCLAEVASWRIEGVPAPAGLTATGEPSDVGQRIRRLAEVSPKPDRWSFGRRRLVLWTTAALLTAGFALWAPRAAWTSPQREAISPAPDDQPAASAAPSPPSTERTALRSDALAPAAATSATEAADESDGDAALWHQLNIELRELSDSLRQLAAALADQPDDPELALLGLQLRRRAAELDSRRIRLITRLGGHESDLNPSASASVSSSPSPGASP